MTIPISETLLQTMKRKKKQVEALQILGKQPEQKMAVKDLQNLGINKDILNKLAESKLLEYSFKQVFRDSYRQWQEGERASFTLTDEQQQALAKIKPALTTSQEMRFLLHGVTGSGKTLVYIEAAKTAEKMGKQVLLMVPEIVLTGQLVTSFKKYFGDRVVVIHSKLTINERSDTFERIRSGEAHVVIGARSALFSPFIDLGLIIID